MLMGGDPRENRTGMEARPEAAACSLICPIAEQDTRPSRTALEQGGDHPQNQAHEAQAGKTLPKPG